MLLEYSPGDSFLHRADVRSKLVAFVALVAVTFLVVNPWVNGVVALASLLLLMLLGLGMMGVLRVFAPLTVVVAIIFLFAAFSPPNGADLTVVTHVLPGGHLALTVGGVEHGANLALRILTMVAVSTVLILTTPVEQFTTLMQRLHMPHALVFIAVTSLRFVPTMQVRSEQILDAQRARGARVDSGGLIGKIKAYVTIMVPLFSTGIRMSEELAGAMVSRGYGLVPRPTVLHDLRWRAVDWVIVLVALGLTAGALASRFTTW